MMKNVIILSNNPIFSRIFCELLPQLGYQLVDKGTENALLIWDGDGEYQDFMMDRTLCVGSSRITSCPTIGLPVRVKDLLQALSLLSLSQDNRSLEYAGLVLIPKTRVLQDNHQEIRLTTAEFDLMRMLMSAKGNWVSRDQLLTCVLGYHSDAETHTLETHLYRLRQKIDLSHILQVQAGAYRLVSPINVGE